MKATITKRVWQSKDIFSLELTLESVITPTPGQFVLLNLPGFDQRAYSIVKHKESKLMLGIKVGSGTSKALSELELGSSFEILGPFGTFTPRNAKHVVFIGGGIGITPLISLYKHYKEKGVSVDVLLSSQDNFVFLEEFDSPKLFNTVSERRIQVSDIKQGAVIYICGPQEMVSSLREGLIKRGHDKNTIFSEDFS